MNKDFVSRILGMDRRLGVLERKTGQAPAFLRFDAGSASAARPSVPDTTVVLWFNTTTAPTNLGSYDLWIDSSGYVRG